MRVAAEPLRVLLKKGQALEWEAELPRFVFAPVHAGGEAGRIRAVVDGCLRGEARLLYEETVGQDREEKSIWSRL